MSYKRSHIVVSCQKFFFIFRTTNFDVKCDVTTIFNCFFDVITFDVSGCYEVAFLDSETSTKKCKTRGWHTFQIRKFQSVLSYIFQKKDVTLIYVYLVDDHLIDQKLCCFKLLQCWVPQDAYSINIH